MYYLGYQRLQLCSFEIKWTRLRGSSLSLPCWQNWGWKVILQFETVLLEWIRLVASLSIRDSQLPDLLWILPSGAPWWSLVFLISANHIFQEIIMLIWDQSRPGWQPTSYQHQSTFSDQIYLRQLCFKRDYVDLRSKPASYRHQSTFIWSDVFSHLRQLYFWKTETEMLSPHQRPIMLIWDWSVHCWQPLIWRQRVSLF